MVQFEKKAGRPMPGPFPMFRKGKLEEKGESAVSSDGKLATGRCGSAMLPRLSELQRLRALNNAQNAFNSAE
jgi:hypothetical protein